MRLPRTAAELLYGRRVLNSTRELVEEVLTLTGYHQLLEYRLLEEEHRLRPDLCPAPPAKPSDVSLSRLSPLPTYFELYNSLQSKIAADTGTQVEGPVVPVKSEPSPLAFLVTGLPGALTAVQLMTLSDLSEKVNVIAATTSADEEPPSIPSELSIEPLSLGDHPPRADPTGLLDGSHLTVANNESCLLSPDDTAAFLATTAES